MRLVDYFIPLTALIKSFERTPEWTPESLAGQIDELINQAQSQALKDGIELPAFQQALFPVLAWADERISRRHNWTTEHAWQKHLLQRRYFKTGLAGREFFDRLEQLDSNEVAVREVFILCLSLGFLGRYSTSPNSAELTNLRLSHYKQLQSHDKALAQDKNTLFPAAYGRASEPTGKKKSGHTLWGKLTLRRLLVFLLPPIIVLLVAAVLHTELTIAVQQFRQAINL